MVQFSSVDTASDTTKTILSLSATCLSKEEWSAGDGRQMVCDRITDMKQNAECEIRFSQIAAERDTPRDPFLG